MYSSSQAMPRAEAARAASEVSALSPTPDTSGTVLQTFLLLCFSLMMRESTHLQLWAKQSQQSVESPFPPGASRGLKPSGPGFQVRELRLL